MDVVTTEQIIAHRAVRKTSGLMGCLTGEDLPLHSLKGISWRPADPMNPGCFCHDCRSLWDKDGSIDLELIKQGNERALFTYASILPSKKDILRDLRAKTDDALEDFVTAQNALAAKLDIIKDFDEKIKDKESSYSSMTKGMSYAFIKAYEAEIDGIDSEIRRLKTLKSYHEKDATELEAKCRQTETALTNARNKERVFIDKNL